MWFTNIPANAKYSKLSDIKTTFMDGGYFRYDLSDTLSIISLNSISLNMGNKNDLDGSKNQLAFLEA